MKAIKWTYLKYFYNFCCTTKIKNSKFYGHLKFLLSNTNRKQQAVYFNVLLFETTDTFKMLQKQKGTYTWNFRFDGKPYLTKEMLWSVDNTISLKFVHKAILYLHLRWTTFKDKNVEFITSMELIYNTMKNLSNKFNFLRALCCWKAW